MEVSMPLRTIYWNPDPFLCLHWLLTWGNAFCTFLMLLISSLILFDVVNASFKDYRLTEPDHHFKVWKVLIPMWLCNFLLNVGPTEQNFYTNCPGSPSLNYFFSRSFFIHFWPNWHQMWYTETSDNSPQMILWILLNYVHDFRFLTLLGLK